MAVIYCSHTCNHMWRTIQIVLENGPRNSWRTQLDWHWLLWGSLSVMFEVYLEVYVLLSLVLTWCWFSLLFLGCSAKFRRGYFLLHSYGHSRNVTECLHCFVTEKKSTKDKKYLSILHSFCPYLHSENICQCSERTHMCMYTAFKNIPLRIAGTQAAFGSVQYSFPSSVVKLQLKCIHINTLQ